MKSLPALLLLSGLVMNAQTRPPQSPPPDVIFVNGDIYTGAELGFGGKPAKVYARAQAIAVRDGRVVAVGATRQIRELKGARTQVVDLAGQPAVPVHDLAVEQLPGQQQLAAGRGRRGAPEPALLAIMSGIVTKATTTRITRNTDPSTLDSQRLARSPM